MRTPSATSAKLSATRQKRSGPIRRQPPESQEFYYAFSQGHEYGDNQGRVAFQETRSFYGIAPGDGTLPSLATENELVAWGKRIIDGEEYRIRKANMPVTNPSIAVVKARYEKFLETCNHYKTINRRAAECVSRTSELRREADELITSLWNEIEASFSSLTEEEKRASAEKYGLVYVFRKERKRHRQTFHLPCSK